MAQASFDQTTDSFLRWFTSLPGATFSEAIKMT